MGIFLSKPSNCVSQSDYRSGLNCLPSRQETWSRMLKPPNEQHGCYEQDRLIVTRKDRAASSAWRTDTESQIALYSLYSAK
jgi:hypothetical protein